jgi:sporulation protein YlmC with PRC-barrel domain
MSMSRDDRPYGEPTNLTGHTVLDDHHNKVGTVKDVLYDDRGDPRWAIVDPGPLRPAKFVPVEGSYVTEVGEVVIPYNKDQVKHAPKAPRDHVLDSATESQLIEHYEVGGSN